MRIIRHWPHRRKARQRTGAILIVVMAILLLLVVISAGLLTVGQRAGVETSHAITKMQAYWAAEAGAQLAVAMSQLRTKPFEYYDRPTGSQGNYLRGSNVLYGALATGSYSVDIVYDPAWTNTGHALKRYLIYSHGVSRAGDKQTITLSAAILSYASYIHASNWEREANGTPIYFLPGDIMNGPVYVNDQLNVMGGSTNPVFYQLVSSTSNAVNYKSGANSNVFRGGLVLNAPLLDIAGNFTSDHIQDVLIDAKNNGGIILTNGNYQFVFKPNSTFTYQAGTISGSPPTISLSGAITTNNLQAWPDGLSIYVGNSAFVQGTVNGKVTLATGNSIYIPTNIVYQSATNPPPPWTGTNGFDITKVDDALGLIASNQVMVTAQVATEIHAAIMVTSGDPGFNAFYKDVALGDPYLKLFGGLTEFRRGVVKRNINGNNNGFLKNYQFDSRFLVDAPPFFPYSIYVFSNWKQSSN